MGGKDIQKYLGNKNITIGDVPILERIMERFHGFGAKEQKPPVWEG